MADALPLRFATYNVHACIARDGRGVARIAEVLAAVACDVVALQEIDVGRPRSGAFHQAEEIARILGFAVAFGAAWDRGGSGSYGNAILSRWPILHRGVRALPELRGFRCEPRCVVEARIGTPRGEVDVWCTHLGVRRGEREAQGRVLVETIAARTDSRPLVLLGDLNCGPDGTLARAVRAHLADARRDASRRTATYPARFPVLALDHIFVGAPLAVHASGTFRGSGASTASDHLPFVADVAWSPPGEGADGRAP